MTLTKVGPDHGRRQLMRAYVPAAARVLRWYAGGAVPWAPGSTPSPRHLRKQHPDADDEELEFLATKAAGGDVHCGCHDHRTATGDPGRGPPG